jgi:hypothetical protein
MFDIRWSENMRKNARPYPRITTRAPSKYPDFNGYNVRHNYIILGDVPTEDLVINSLIHETTHWAQFMFLDREEREKVVCLYDKMLEDFYIQILHVSRMFFSEKHILERVFLQHRTCKEEVKQ